MLVVDPPEGWKYGFPKEIHPETLKDERKFKNFLRSSGYPDDMIGLALKYSRYWESNLNE